LVGATAALLVVGIGVRQFEPLSNERSIVDHVSIVHGKISTILAAATGKSYDSSVELLIDSIKNKGKKFSIAMGMKAKLKVGGDGKWPKVVVAFGAKSGKVSDLKKKFTTLFEDSLTSAPKDRVAEIKKAVTFKVDGDSVIVSITPPKGEFTHEDEELKAALKTHKPVFSADFAVAQKMEYILDHKSMSIGAALGGIEAKVGAMFAESIIKALSDMPGLPPPAQAALGLWRSSKLRNEMYYDDKHLAGLPLPPVKKILPRVCEGLSPRMAKHMTGIKDELKEVQQVVVEGLPYQWEITVDMKGFNPAPLAEFCGH